LRGYKDERIRRNCDWLVNASRKKIFMALGNTPEPVYAGMIAEVGVGGVETTYIELADCMAALGHEVFLFSRCEAERVAGHVRYIPYERMMEFADVKPDVVITSRWFDAMYQFPSAKKIVWLQDAHYADPNHADAWQVADLVVCSSPWHRDYILERHGPGMPRGKLVVQPLGIRKAQFAGLDEGQRDPLRVIYSSNPDRGLEQLGQMWPEITRRVPGIHLVVTYGWEGLKTWGQDADWQAHVDAKRARILGLFDGHDNVRFTGRLKKTDLYAEMKRCALCLYSNTFWETYGLTALECQAAGMPMVTSKIGALTTTCNPRANVLLEGNPYGQNYAGRFVAEVEDLLVAHPERLAALREQALEHVAKSPCDWMDVARRWERVIWMLQ
jgi:glycosyltransferase involved in cell wall biosynthesis